VDTHGNASPIFSGFVQGRCQPSILSGQYRQAGGQSTGGYCSLTGRGARLGGHFVCSGQRARGPDHLPSASPRPTAFFRGLPCLLVGAGVRFGEAQVTTHEESDEMSEEPRGEYRTPKQWAMELRFGPYAPDVDSEFAGSTGNTPYKTMFGGKRHLMSQVGVRLAVPPDLRLPRRRHAIGYYNVSAKAFVFDPSTGQCVARPDHPSACARSGDATSLRAHPDCRSSGLPLGRGG